MRVVGIIAEYNPFHKGHEYQIRKAHEQFGPESAILVVMSGYFVQRGEPALAGKWARTEAALRCGADLVLEIPFTFACASAERFAHGAVSMLNASGVVSDLYFGSECDDLAMMCCLAEEYDEENPVYIASLREHLRAGQSYARARELAVSSLFIEAGKPELADASSKILRLPNSILALEYLIALKRTSSSIAPSALQRAGAGYNDCSQNTEFSSATGIRKIIEENMNEGIAGTGKVNIASLANALTGMIPDSSLAVLLAEWQSGIRPVSADTFIGEQIMWLRAQTAGHLDSCAYMGDHLAQRFKNSVGRLRETTIDQLHNAFRDASDTRRFATTRINRALTSMLIGQTVKDLEKITAPEYLRVLGFSGKGRYILRLMRKAATLPIIDKASDFLQFSQNANLTRSAELDLISAEKWGLAAGLRYGDEFERSVIRLTDTHKKKGG
jgi:predicted nucleotidyltransferase